MISLALNMLNKITNSTGFANFLGFFCASIFVKQKLCYYILHTILTQVPNLYDNLECKQKTYVRFYCFSKGQLISECLMVCSISSKKRTKRSRPEVLVKSNTFVHFLEELRIPKSTFEIILPLIS